MKMTPQDLLSFRRMITPVIVHVIFWILAGFLVLAGLAMFLRGLLMLGEDAAQALGQMFVSILFIVLGPLAVRIWCEMVVVVFRINETLTDIRSSLLNSVPQNDLPNDSRLND